LYLSVFICVHLWMKFFFDRLSEIRLDHLRITLHLFRRSHRDRFAVIENGDSLANAHHQLHVVLDQPDAHAELVADETDQLRQIIFLLRVHSCCRLVEQKNPGLGRQRPRDLESPLIAVGKIFRELASLARELKRREQRGAFLSRRLALIQMPRASQHGAEQIMLRGALKADGHVVEHGEFAEQSNV